MWWQSIIVGCNPVIVCSPSFSFSLPSLFLCSLNAISDDPKSPANNNAYRKPFCLIAEPISGHMDASIQAQSPLRKRQIIPLSQALFRRYALMYYSVLIFLIIYLSPSGPLENCSIRHRPSSGWSMLSSPRLQELFPLFFVVPTCHRNFTKIPTDCVI
ncbi:hypothetical protein CI102_5955 [Trichoderma harzianum]|nr:hypothetical protein CI102_5955 [Trichoderma harzianum]